MMVLGTDATELHPSLDAQPDDVVLTKCRFGVFSNTALRVILTAHQITSLVLAGISTGGVILNMVVDGADMDFKVTVLSDGVVDSNTELHNALLQHLFTRRGYVETTANWIASLN